MNSIRKALADNEDEAVARIRLILNTDVTAGKVLMVVEGKSDADLYKRMYSPSKVEVDSAGGARQVRLVCDKLGKRTAMMWRLWCWDVRMSWHLFGGNIANPKYSPRGWWS